MWEEELMCEYLGTTGVVRMLKISRRLWRGLSHNPPYAGYVDFYDENIYKISRTIYAEKKTEKHCFADWGYALDHYTNCVEQVK